MKSLGSQSVIKLGKRFQKDGSPMYYAKHPTGDPLPIVKSLSEVGMQSVFADFCEVFSDSQKQVTSLNMQYLYLFLCRQETPLLPDTQCDMNLLRRLMLDFKASCDHQADSQSSAPNCGKWKELCVILSLIDMSAVII